MAGIGAAILLSAVAPAHAQTSGNMIYAVANVPMGFC